MKDFDKQRTVLYARVSKDDQNPENQLVELKEYIKNHPQLVLTKIYEEFISGKTDSRPRLDELMQDARQHKFDHVVVWKVDRLGRHTAHMLQTVEEWHSLGINFTITTLGIDTSTPVGWFVFGLLAQVAELERQFIVERTNASIGRIKKQLEKKGKFVTKDGKVRTALGRPKGKKDSKPRKKRGYLLRDYKKRTPRKSADYYKDK